MRPAARLGVEARVVESRVADHLAEPPPVVVVPHREDDPHVFAQTRIAALRGVVGVAVPPPGLDLAGEDVVEEGVGEEDGAALQERQVDVLALPGAPPVVERGLNSQRGVRAGDRVRVEQ